MHYSCFPWQKLQDTVMYGKIGTKKKNKWPKQCELWSDCSCKSSLIRVLTFAMSKTVTEKSTLLHFTKILNNLSLVSWTILGQLRYLYNTDNLFFFFVNVKEYIVFEFPLLQLFVYNYVHWSRSVHQCFSDKLNHAISPWQKHATVLWLLHCSFPWLKNFIIVWPCHYTSAKRWY